MFQKQMLAWNVFNDDVQVRDCILLYCPEAHDVTFYKKIMEELWERVMKNPKMFSKWKNRADHINENRSIAN